MSKLKRAIGLMSGTSMDGVDIALVDTDGESRIERGPSASMPYSDGFRARLKAALGDARAITERQQRPGILEQLERDLTLLHAVALHDFLYQNGLKPQEIDVVGFHGQTVLHRPQASLTVQLGDGELLASETGIPIVYDMRAEDMRNGGEGAPLIPAYHASLAQSLSSNLKLPAVFVNIGGISNLTYVGSDGSLVAYDSGPGNMLIDQWIELNGRGSFDAGGDIATSGEINREIADRYLDNPFFKANCRSSLDRSDFPPLQAGELSLADGARTLAYVSAASIMHSAKHLPSAPQTYIISGGGRLNKSIMRELAALATAQGATVMDADELGLNGDSMEAEAWGFLAVRSQKGLPLTYPTTTGCTRPVSGGVLAMPEK